MNDEVCFISEIEVDQLNLIGKAFILRSFRNDVWKNNDSSRFGFRRQDDAQVSLALVKTQLCATISIQFRNYTLK